MFWPECFQGNAEFTKLVLNRVHALAASNNYNSIVHVAAAFKLVAPCLPSTFNVLAGVASPGVATLLEKGHLSDSGPRMAPTVVVALAF